MADEFKGKSGKLISVVKIHNSEKKQADVNNTNSIRAAYETERRRSIVSALEYLRSLLPDHVKNERTTLDVATSYINKLKEDTETLLKKKQYLHAKVVAMKQMKLLLEDDLNVVCSYDHTNDSAIIERVDRASKFRTNSLNSELLSPSTSKLNSPSMFISDPPLTFKGKRNIRNVFDARLNSSSHLTSDGEVNNLTTTTSNLTYYCLPGNSKLSEVCLKSEDNVEEWVYIITEPTNMIED